MPRIPSITPRPGIAFQCDRTRSIGKDKSPARAPCPCPSASDSRAPPLLVASSCAAACPYNFDPPSRSQCRRFCWSFSKLEPSRPLRIENNPENSQFLFCDSVDFLHGEPAFPQNIPATPRPLCLSRSKKRVLWCNPQNKSRVAFVILQN